jgi:hypothetical protein
MIDEDVPYIALAETQANERGCGCGPACNCGPGCVCTPAAKCAPACGCAD